MSHAFSQTIHLGFTRRREGAKGFRSGDMHFDSMNRSPNKLMEDTAEYLTTSSQARPVRPLDDPDFIGAEAALKRGSAKAVARDLAAGLEPIVRTQPDAKTTSSR